MNRAEKNRRDQQKLELLSEIEGYENSDMMLQDSMMDSIVPGICMNDSCSATYSYEPDSRNGWCGECKTKTVESCLSLAGLA
jgi:hypothetical protein